MSRFRTRIHFEQRPRRVSLTCYSKECPKLYVEVSATYSKLASIFIRKMVYQELFNMRHAHKLNHAALRVGIRGGSAKQIVSTSVRRYQEAARAKHAPQLVSSNNVRGGMFVGEESQRVLSPASHGLRVPVVAAMHIGVRHRSVARLLEPKKAGDFALRQYCGNTQESGDVVLRNEYVILAV